MGYRVKLGSFPKGYVADALRKSKNEEEARRLQVILGENTSRDLEDNWPMVLKSYKTLYEIGKYVSYSKGMQNFYDWKDPDCELKVVEKEGLKHIIEDYHTSVVEGIENSLKVGKREDGYESLEIKGVHEPAKFLDFKLKEWKNFKPYYLDEEGTDGAISSSWRFEYAIFNLVFIYRTFDWENYYLMYRGS